MSSDDVAGLCSFVTDVAAYPVARICPPISLMGLDLGIWSNGFSSLFFGRLLFLIYNGQINWVMPPCACALSRQKTDGWEKLLCSLKSKRFPTAPDLNASIRKRPTTHPSYSPPPLSLLSSVSAWVGKGGSGHVHSLCFSSTVCDAEDSFVFLLLFQPGGRVITGRRIA